MGWLRTAVGAALIVAPKVPMRISGGGEPTGTSVLLMRTIGIRDLVLGFGAVAAARSSDVTGACHWTSAALVSDSLDAATSLGSFRSIGMRDSIIAAVLAFTFVCGDLWVLRQSPGPAENLNHLANRPIAQVPGGTLARRRTSVSTSHHDPPDS